MIIIVVVVVVVFDDVLVLGRVNVGAQLVGSEPELRFKANTGGGFLGIVRRAGLVHRGSVLIITTPATSRKMAVTYGAGVRTKCRGSSRSEKLRPDFLQDRGETIAGAGDLGADLGGQGVTTGEIDRLRGRVRIQVLEVRQGLEGIEKEKVEVWEVEKASIHIWPTPQQFCIYAG